VRNKLKAMDLENKEFARRNEGASEARIRVRVWVRVRVQGSGFRVRVRVQG
jgi:hypothetical protein